MTRFEILGFLGSVNDADAKDLASRFGISEGAVYSRLTILNRQGLVRKTRGEDGLLRFSLTDWGKQKLEWLEEHDEGNLEENKPSGGDKKMARKRYLEDDLYVCPSCGDEYELEDVLEGSPESLCPDCGVELELVDGESEDELDEPVRRGR